MLATSLQIAAAFNLVCSGTVRTGPIGLALPEQDGAPFTITYRIDLDARRWCSEACEETESVASIFEGHILLRDQHGSDGSNVVTIIPALGRFTDTLIEGNRATLRSGTCRPESFSGFPLDLT
jgi:hypothetical protein